MIQQFCSTRSAWGINHVKKFETYKSYLNIFSIEYLTKIFLSICVIRTIILFISKTTRPNESFL